ncbi:MAG: hypothetical protein NC400_12180 [Clostridium sp.]|nr:hypothetical protein [Clostridium sp.]
MPLCRGSYEKSADYDQLVIAVMDKKLADSIKEELEEIGVDREKIIWLHPNQGAVWDTKGIG